MCDYNGHMNVLFYFKIFIDNLETYYENELGFSKEYFSFKAILSAFPLDAIKSFLEEETLGIEFPERESNPKVISNSFF